MTDVQAQLLTVASGKAGDIVGAHNQGGQYFRTFTPPDNTMTPARNQARNAMAAASRKWNDDLTQQQRDDWKTYAQNIEHVDRIGQPITHIGRNLFIRAFVINRLVPGPDPLDAPTIFNRSTFTAVTFTHGNPPRRLNIFFDPTDEWAQTQGGALYIQAAAAVTQTINFFKAPFRTAQSIRRGPMPITSPQSINSPFSYSTNDRIFIRVRAITSDARVTTPQITSFDVP